MQSNSVFDKTILFSGRFDPPHLGHAISVFRLLERYACVVVVALDYVDAAYSLCYRLHCLREAFEHLRDRVQVSANRAHFAKITRAEVSSLGLMWDVYGSGNDACLQHMESLGYATEYVPRSIDVSATDLRVGRDVANIIRKHGG